ncbi:MAG: MarR family transcriptional regulator [Sphingorhabdus sp.]|nr:MarR family transcriptional regulator [Sphingorhabdus sp.]
MEDYSNSSPLLWIVTTDAALESTVAKIAALAGWRAAPRLAAMDEASTSMPATPPRAILADIRSGSETEPREIAKAAEYAGRHDIAFIVWTDMRRLDEADALADGSHAALLVDPEPAEAVYALTRARSRQGNRAREKRGESRELMRLSDELVEMARRVAALTRNDEGGGVRADPLSYRGAPPGHDGALGAAGAAPTIAPERIREMIRLRRMREDEFASDLFADPAWDMLLDLTASRIEDKPVSVSSLCIASAVPATTALRWIKLMTDRGMLERRADSADARRIFIDLSDETYVRMQRLLGQMLAGQTPPV